MDSLPNFEVCNRTELYQLCARAGILVLPSSTKEQMISYLTGEQNPPPVTEGTHQVHSWRHGLTGFVFEYWDKLEPQLTCPIRSKDRRSCFGCLDMQVMHCVVDNPAVEQLIELHRRKQ